MVLILVSNDNPVSLSIFFYGNYFVGNVHEREIYFIIIFVVIILLFIIEFIKY